MREIRAGDLYWVDGEHPFIMLISYSWENRCLIGTVIGYEGSQLKEPYVSGFGSKEHAGLLAACCRTERYIGNIDDVIRPLINRS